MITNTHPDITELIELWRDGHKNAYNDLIEIVIGDLKRMAHTQMKEKGYRPIETTELVHDVFIKVQENGPRDWQNRRHFFQALSLMLEHHWVDICRTNGAQKRGGDLTRVPLDDIQKAVENSPDTVLMVSQALEKLKEEDELTCELIRLRFFARYTIKESAKILGIPVIQANRSWSFAKTWLYNFLKNEK